jgi:glycerol uptake facilitator-like aquaporin
VKLTLTKRVAAEALGTALLLAAIVGSGIMGERLAAGNVALALLANSIATGTVLGDLILTFGPISGAHFNPVVTLASAVQQDIQLREVPFYIAAQIGVSFLGVATAHIMFGLPLFFVSLHDRSGSAQIFSEAVATFGLVTVILLCAKFRPPAVPLAVAGYITGAYGFTASTSFANPAVTLARSVTDTFVGVRPLNVPAFVVAQLVGALAATIFCRWLLPKERTRHHEE